MLIAITKSVTNNKALITATFLIGIIVIYVFTIAAFNFIDDIYFNTTIGDAGERACTNVWHCFQYTLNYVNFSTPHISHLHLGHPKRRWNR